MPRKTKYFQLKFVTIDELKGKTITKIKNENGGGRVVIFTKEGPIYRMDHQQDCCETVLCTEIEGEIEQILNSPVTNTKEIIEHDEEGKLSDYESLTLTDFLIETESARLLIKWLGTSNGYYSESVIIEEIYSPQQLENN